MKHEDIIRMALEAGFIVAETSTIGINKLYFHGYCEKELLKFAAMVAEFEREECKQVCDRIEIERGPWGRQGHAGDCAAAIGARGKA